MSTDARPLPTQEDGGQRERITNTLREPLPPGAISLRVIALVAVVAALDLGQPLLAPVFLALLISFLLLPVIRRIERWGVAPPVGAVLVLAPLGGAFVLGTYLLSGPALAWAADIPEILAEAEYKLRDLLRPVEAMARAAESVEGLADLEEENGEPFEIPTVPHGGATATDGIFRFVGSTLVTGFLLFFLLASSDSFLRTVVRVLPKLGQKKIAVEIARKIESHVARYLLTIFVINLSLGIVVAGWAFLMDLPSPLLWGALAFLANFVPYAGAVIVATVLAIVAFVSQDDPMRALLVPAGYLSLSGVEGMLITPTVLGGRLTLRPVIVFLWLAAWSWLWGIIGALIAVPLLVVVRSLSDNVPSMRLLGQFLAREQPWPVPPDDPSVTP